MNRIALIRSQLASNNCNNRKEIKIVKSAYDYLNFDEFLTTEERAYRKRLREYLDEEVTPKLIKDLEKSDFSYEIVEKFNKAFPGIASLNIKGYGCPGFSFWLCSAIVMELSRCDASFCTYIMVHGGELAMKSIDILGSDEQKSYYLPKMNKGELIGCFCLTEPEYGSDASSLKTSAQEDGEGNIIINGQKRWIGNGTHSDVYIVWARSTKTKEVEGFIVPKGAPGLTATKIEGKLALRGVQNANITFKDVKIPIANRLPKATNFQKGVNQVLLFSRLGVAWSSVGLSIGAYDRAVEYCSQRKQFGKSLTSFQLVQEKLSRMMGNIQASLYLCKRTSELFLSGKMTVGKVGLTKAWCTLRGRETVALAREIMGGNGILYENWVMKGFVDAEALYTYEGTYDINMLVAGKELTGIQAIR